MISALIDNTDANNNLSVKRVTGLADDISQAMDQPSCNYSCEDFVTSWLNSWK